MKVKEFLNTITKDQEVAEYYQEIIIQTYTKNITDSRTLAHGNACELLKINNIENVVQNLQEFSIVEIKRIPTDNLPLYNCPYLLTVV